ncbi:protein ECT2 [Nephila pilipes]|uniref:Protein ECT2 n=1 Tax=Nephila pilipes TaxID=299642 RepID=A0A8X6PUV4_NEPPI|nr:protein ECT2 [Nephila pilipes]
MTKADRGSVGTISPVFHEEPEVYRHPYPKVAWQMFLKKCLQCFIEDIFRILYIQGGVVSAFSENFDDSITGLKMSSINIPCNGHKNSTSRSDLTFQVCVVGETLRQNEALIKAIEHFHLPIVYSSSGLELINQGGEFTTIYVLEEFEGDVFSSLHKAGQRILGPTTVMQYAKKDESFPNNIRPLYTTSMKSLVITFSGFRSKEDLTSMVNLVHHMGGSIRKDFSITKTTHLVATASSTNGEKYKYSASMGIPIMTAEWIYQAWAKRHDVNCIATNEELMQYKLLPFVGCKLAFVGYSKDEQQHMIEISIKNGGKVSDDPKDKNCTHIVVEDGHSVDSSEYEYDVYVLKNEWFWACIQMEAKAEERIYIFENLTSTMTSSSFIMPIKGNKRKRLESVAHQLALESQENEIYSINTELRRKTEAKLSISGSFLDATLSPDKTLEIKSPECTDNEKVHAAPLDMRVLSPRQQVCYELFQTESNYVGILHTVMTVFKEPLENLDQVGGALLAPAEIKIIFGNLPPLFEIHQKIRIELTDIIYSWREDHSIGNVILNHAHEFMKSYPPFVNFFEKTKEVLATCDATKPRFHAFLKRCQSKPECGRQTLQELLIRPVQRLPSVILLLNDILKHTPKSNPDNQALEKAIQSLKDVLMHINEDKRKTEGQVEMFDIVNDIENCPPNLLSSHRNLVYKTDMQEVTDMLNKKSGVVTMFLFNDVLEICKKRGKVNNSLKSPGVTSLTTGTLKTQSKSYKHLDLIPLGHIKRVVDVTETEECKNVFAIVCWSSKELKELLYVFILLDDICKKEFLRILCRQVANSVCKADSENLLAILEPHQLDLPASENTGNALTKALNKTRNKLGRALSMRRTPTKRGLSRAVSTIISPLRSFSTPSNTISTLRLSSVTNLTELEPPNSSLTPSPVGGKKMKSGSLGVSVAKYF